jgi:hypothetical protein
VVNSKPVLGDVVKVLSPTYNHFYRAKILSAESENFFWVSYIDYGDIEIAELCNIFELSDNLKNIVSFNCDHNKFFFFTSIFVILHILHVSAGKCCTNWN